MENKKEFEYYLEKYRKKFDIFILKIEKTIPCEKCKQLTLTSFIGVEKRNPYLIEFYCTNHSPTSMYNEYKWIRRLNPEIEKEHYKLVKTYEKLKKDKYKEFNHEK